MSNSHKLTIFCLTRSSDSAYVSKIIDQTSIKYVSKKIVPTVRVRADARNHVMIVYKTTSGLTKVQKKNEKL